MKLIRNWTLLALILHLRPISGAEFSYEDYLPGSFPLIEQGKCSFIEDPSLVFFYSFHPQIARRLLDYVLPEDTETIGTIEYGTPLPGIKNPEGHLDYQITAPFLSQDLEIVVVPTNDPTWSGKKIYRLRTQASYRSLGKHEIDINLSSTSDPSFVRPFSSVDSKNRHIPDRTLELKCQFQPNTWVNGEEVGD